MTDGNDTFDGTDPFSGMFDEFEFDPYDQPSMSEEDQLAIRLYKAGSALREFVEYIHEHDDFDPNDDRLYRGVSHLDGDQRALMMAFASFGQDLEDLSEEVGDDDDENQFRVN
jgi:hypothetical protein